MNDENFKSNYQLDQASMSIKDKQKAMTTEDLCIFLKEIGIEDKYIELLKQKKVNGCELAVYDEQDLEELGIDRRWMRKKIISRFEMLT